MKILKTIKEILAEPLTIIINQMLNRGIFPDLLKIAKVTPIYMKDDETSFTNYRPISLLPAISKIFEKLYLSKPMNFFRKKNIFILVNMDIEKYIQPNLWL